MSAYVNKVKMGARADGDTQTPWLLRGKWDLTGMKYGCDLAGIGAIPLDRTAVIPCLYPLKRRRTFHPDYRRPIARRRSSRASGLSGRRHSAMRLLPLRPGHGRWGASRALFSLYRQRQAMLCRPTGVATALMPTSVDATQRVAA